MLHTDFHSKPLERDSMILIKAFLDKMIQSIIFPAKKHRDSSKLSLQTIFQNRHTILLLLSLNPLCLLHLPAYLFIYFRWKA